MLDKNIYIPGNDFGSHAYLHKRTESFASHTAFTTDNFLTTQTESVIIDKCDETDDERMATSEL